MSDASPTAYEILGVNPTASHDDLRRAYRRLLRETHPDLGGSTERFHAVQRAWAELETPELRRRYDLEHVAPRPGAERRSAPHRSDSRSPADAPPTSRPRASSASGERSSPRAAASRAARDAEGSALRARSYGHPGGESRSRFFTLLREWAGRGSNLDNPYDPVLLRSAPREIRQWLAKALAEEATATIVGTLGPDFTIWSDVAAGDGIVDHVVVGPSGAYALASEDWGSPVEIVKGEIESTRLEPGEAPVKWFAKRAKALSRSTGVRFAGLLIVVPDDALTAPMVMADRKKSGSVVVVRRELLPAILVTGAPDWGLVPPRRWDTDQLFSAREILQSKLRLV